MYETLVYKAPVWQFERRLKEGFYSVLFRINRGLDKMFSAYDETDIEIMCISALNGTYLVCVIYWLLRLKTCLIVWMYWLLYTGYWTFVKIKYTQNVGMFLRMGLANIKCHIWGYFINDQTIAVIFLYIICGNAFFGLVGSSQDERTFKLKNTIPTKSLDTF